MLRYKKQSPFCNIYSTKTLANLVNSAYIQYTEGYTAYALCGVFVFNSLLGPVLEEGVWVPEVPWHGYRAVSAGVRVPRLQQQPGPNGGQLQPPQRRHASRVQPDCRRAQRNWPQPREGGTCPQLELGGWELFLSTLKICHVVPPFFTKLATNGWCGGWTKLQNKY